MEIFIKNLYQSIELIEPHQLTISFISKALGIKVHYWEFASAIAERRGKYIVFTNNTVNDQQQWQDFGYGMKHYFFNNNIYIHLVERILAYKEIKADYFAYHFCVPSFMLDDLNKLTVYEVKRKFNVESDFALKRLIMYQGKKQREIFGKGTY